MLAFYFTIHNLLESNLFELCQPEKAIQSIIVFIDIYGYYLAYCMVLPNILHTVFILDSYLSHDSFILSSFLTSKENHLT